MQSDFALRALLLYYRLRYSVLRPDGFVLTGIPRSGTSLLSTLLCEPEDCFCFNEIFYDPATLPYFLGRMKKKLVRGEPVPAKVGDDGALTTDTLVGKVTVGTKAFPPKAGDVVVGSNVNIPYLDRIDEILRYRYPVIAMIRDPVYTLASWNSPKADVIPEAHVSDDDMSSRWQHTEFDSLHKEDRQADIWERYAALIHSLRDRAEIVRYEDLCDRRDETLQRIYDFLGVTAPAETRDLKNLNVDSRFGDLSLIREAVARRCPTRQEFGYA